jgi:hypothetical protein
VACENGTRPPGVLTYPVTDAAELAALLARTLEDRQNVVAGLAAVPLPDTLTPEIAVLTAEG